MSSGELHLPLACLALRLDRYQIQKRQAKEYILSDEVLSAAIQLILAMCLNTC